MNIVIHRQAAKAKILPFMRIAQLMASHLKLLYLHAQRQLAGSSTLFFDGSSSHFLAKAGNLQRLVCRVVCLFTARRAFLAQTLISSRINRVKLVMCLFANTSSIWAVRFESAKIFFGKYLCSNMSLSAGCGAGSGGVEVMSQELLLVCLRLFTPKSFEF